MIIGQHRNCFEFNNNFPEANEVGNVGLLKRVSLVFQTQFFLRIKRHRLEPQFKLKTLLINSLMESETFFVIDLHTSTNHLVRFIFIDKLCHDLPSCIYFARLA